MIPLRDSQPSRSMPVATALIIAVNVAVFLFEFSLDEYSRNYFVSLYAMTPETFRWSTVFTSMFLHAGLLHLAGNMWFLWIFGDNVEDVLGKAKYVLFYLASGVAAALVHYATNMDSRIPTVGASGAIAGVMGAYMIRFPHSSIRTLVFAIIFIDVVEIPAFWMLLYWLGLQVIQGLWDLGRAAHEGGVAWFAHVGGFVAGMVLIRAVRTEDRYRNYREFYW